MIGNFVVGTRYSRDEIYFQYHQSIRPRGGAWDTGIVRSLKGTPTNDDLIFMLNIGVPGRTGHDFDNTYDLDTKILETFSKPGGKSTQPQLRNLINKNLVPQIFIRYDNSDVKYIYVGSAELSKYEDGHITTYSDGRESVCVKLVFKVGNVVKVIRDLDDLCDLDKKVSAAKRMEQQILRDNLLGENLSALCGICGHLVPIEFLRASHIKKRSQCTDSEKLDIPAIAMPMCLMGCDALFELGYVSIEHGNVKSSTSDNFEIQNTLDELSGRKCVYWSSDREKYFLWHKDNVFLN